MEIIKLKNKSIIIVIIAAIVLFMAINQTPVLSDKTVNIDYYKNCYESYSKIKSFSYNKNIFLNDFVLKKIYDFKLSNIITPKSSYSQSTLCQT